MTFVNLLNIIQFCQTYKSSCEAKTLYQLPHFLWYSCLSLSFELHQFDLQDLMRYLTSHMLGKAGLFVDFFSFLEPKR